MDNTEPRPSISSALSYKDPKSALCCLERAFGFEPFMVILGANDELMHSEMRSIPKGIWIFGQTVQRMTSTERDARMPGVKTRTRL